MSRRFKRRRSLKERDRRAEEPHHDGVFFRVVPWRTRHAPPTSTANSTWCTTQALPLRAFFYRSKGDPDQRFAKVRCPHCGRRLRPMTVDVENGYGEFYAYLPRHKVRKTHQPRKRKQTRAGTPGRNGLRG